jgi:hypothetical protein
VIAHVGGAPVEELLLPLTTVGTGLALVISLAMSRFRQPRAIRGDSSRRA